MPSSSEANLEKYLIPLDEINRATESFSYERYIGSGGFGAVYKGQLSERWEERIVAVKRLSKDSHQGESEFRNELNVISKFHHENIIAFIGYCDQGGEKIIVYEYASNGSLDDHLREPNKMSRITWLERLEICIGAAKGLQFLHSGRGEHDIVIHRDVKSANILLDGNMVAKICDFGLSKLGTTNQPNTQLNTKVAGTQFYMDPIYHESGILRKESDVYSFGVVLFEILSGMLVYDERHIGDKRLSLMNTVRRHHQNIPNKVLDLSMRDQTESRSFNIFREIAYKCISFDVAIRPRLDTVILSLEKALTNHMYEHLASNPADGSMIESIIAKLNSASPLEQQIALNKICLLIEYCKENCVAFSKVGALIPVLTQLLTAPDSRTREQANTALLNLSLFEGISYSSEAVLGIVDILEKGNSESREHAQIMLLNLSKYENHRGITVCSRAVPGLVHILEKGNNEAQEHALTILLSLSKKRDHVYAGIIFFSGAVVGIVDMLEKGSSEAQENAAEIIYKLSFIDGAKDTIGSAGAIPPLVLLLSEGGTRGKENAGDALWILCLNDDNKGRAVRAGLVPILTEVLMEPQGEWKERIVEILARLLEHLEGRVAIGESVVVPHLVELLGSGHMLRFQGKLLTFLVRLCDMDEKYLIEAQEHGVMGKLKDLLQHGTDEWRREAIKLQRMIKDHQHVDSWLVAIAKRGALQISKIFYKVTKHTCIR